MKNRELINRIKKSKQELLDDPLSWIERQKEQQAKKVKPVKTTVPVKDSSMDYSSQDLEGLQVSHDIMDFEAGKDHILVLKDSDILKDEDDVLVCSSLPAMANEKKGKYTGYDDDEFKTPGHKVNILSQYDDEDDKIVTKGFRLSSSAPQVKESAPEKDLKGISCFVEKKMVTDHDTTFKKIKKKGRSRKKEADLSIDLQDIEHGSTTNKKKITGDFVDDDDLQDAISRVRREKIKMGAEFVANAVSQQKDESSEEEEVGMIISEATEFVRNLGVLPKKDEENQLGALDVKVKEDAQVKVEEDVQIKVEENAQVKVEENIVKQEMLGNGDTKRVHFEDMDVDVKEEDGEAVEDSDETPFHAEPLVSGGLGATLALLSQKGLVQRLSPEEQERANKLRERELWLVEQRKKEKIRMVERQRERESQKGIRHKLSGRDMERQREAEAKRLEREQIRLKEEKFKNYMPDVKIAYYDEFGRELNTKEAYKQLAQKFHGHMPGKKKAEKRLQRIEDERKAKQAESMSLNTAQVVSEAIKQTGNAYITLSVGNRAAKLPTIAPTTKPKTPPPETLPPLVVQHEHNVPLEDSESRGKITFGFKRKAGGSLEEEKSATKKPK